MGYLEKDYLELVDWAGLKWSSFVERRRGYIPEHIPLIFERFGAWSREFYTTIQCK